MRIRLAILAALLLPAVLRAQSVLGSVVDQGGIPVPGVVVLLVDSTGRETSKALSNERGEFRMALSLAGRYRLRTLRVGYRPFTSATMELHAGQNDVRQLVLANVLLSLDTVKVQGKNVCRVDRDSVAATFAVWQQVRTALAATQLTGAVRNIRTSALNYDRTLDRMGHTVLEQRMAVSTRPTSQPWYAESADSLHKLGYVIFAGNDGTTYHAPSLDVLQSDIFVQDHCFRLTSNRDKKLIGIAFEPNVIRKTTPEVSGTLWLDRSTSQLRRMEFDYVNLPSELDLEAGGEMEFLLMRDGTWAISRWQIRMPIIGHVMRAQAIGGDQRVVLQVKVNGGELSLATRDADTLWARPPQVLNGEVTDSVSGKAVAGAMASIAGTSLTALTDSKGRFAMTGMLPGQYTLEVRTPSLDSVSAAHQSAFTFTNGKDAVRVRVPSATQILTSLCGTTPMEGPGIVAGTVAMRGDSSLPQALRVVAEWKETVAATANTGARETPRWRVARPGARGGYRLCGLPLDADITLQSEIEAVNSGAVEPVKVRLSPARRFARTDLVLDRSLVKGAVFAGFVYGDTAQLPLANVEVALPELDKRVSTNERGEFRIRDIPAGQQHVTVRHIGFGPVDATIDFTNNETVDRRVFLSKVTVIDSVVISADRAEMWRGEFEASRKLGFGSFLLRDELAKKESQSMKSVLTDLRGVEVKSGTSGHAWLAASRNTIDAYVPTADIDYWHHALPACYADVFVDNVPVFTGRRRQQLFDLAEIAPGQIEALAYYPDQTNLPSRYLTNRNCGTLVIFTRRK